MYCSIKLPKEMSDLRADIIALQQKVFDARKLSCIQRGMPMLAFIASRHYRTPMIPFLWQDNLLRDESQAEKMN